MKDDLPSLFRFSIDGSGGRIRGSIAIARLERREEGRQRDRSEGSPKGTQRRERSDGRNGRPREPMEEPDGYTNFMMFFDATARGQYEVERK